MSIAKSYLSNKPACKATFKFPREACPEAKTVHLVGEFNNWDSTATPMKKLKNGDFKAVVTLETGRAYQFRYLIDGSRWENDWAADRYVPTPFGNAENSVVDI